MRRPEQLEIVQAQPLTAELLPKLLDYNEKTGVFTWLKKRGNKGNAIPGGIAGSGRRTGGYWAITIAGRIYMAHRLAWLYVHGQWPMRSIDHINGVRTDNRIENLRECTAAENQQNRAIHPKNTSGVAGVSWSKNAKKWTAFIRAGGKQKNIGLFATKEQAGEAYKAAKAALHPFAPTVREAATPQREGDEIAKEETQEIQAGLSSQGILPLEAA